MIEDNEFYPPISLSEAKEILSFLPSSYCNILIKNGVLKSETIGNKIYVTENSIEKFKEQFDINAYYTLSQCNEKLTELDLKDDYHMIKYMSVIPKFDFNVSVKTLVEKKFLVLDRFVGKYISIHSFNSCVVVLKGIIAFNKIKRNEEEKSAFIQSEIELRLKPQMDIWDTEYFHSVRNHIAYDKLKPTLSDDEIKEIEEIAESKFKIVDPSTNGDIKRLSKSSSNSPFSIKKHPFKIPKK